jgi:hypothetical protein
MNVPSPRNLTYALLALIVTTALPLFPLWLGKLAKYRKLSPFPQLRRRLETSFLSNSSNCNLDEKYYLHARYLLLPTCPTPQNEKKIGL